MRIVAGSLRGRPIAAPTSNAIRPTGDRTRETLFNILASELGPDLGGARVLDLFSGTGALGLEALSRGARFCLFVEEGVEGRGLIRTNVESFGLQGRTKIFRRDATALGAVGTIEPFDLVFADPPYGRSLGEAALTSALTNGWLREGARCVLEEAASAPFALPDGFALHDERRVGETVLRFLTPMRGES
ncbi:16S rRNA (guanine(966)-N(2))-methyltransferase RsmD [Mangrovicella endophytica]|uniref:16S rRNA (guanine(966)-N(2))-methyltransferase RsmD n=1 Tax=Mangrovicella endophytica TaxID=2066697 RepID=UPI000C9DBB58|nr:16S rRNA (guanine(966)-N(2))-methyltransferase RsmD [Mangrovicella endophytica]